MTSENRVKRISTHSVTFDALAIEKEAQAEDDAEQERIAQAVTMLDAEDQAAEGDQSSFMSRCLLGPFDHLISVVICLQAASLFLQVQFYGVEVGEQLGFPVGGGYFEGHVVFFLWVEHSFQALYLIEFVLRFATFGVGFCWDFKSRKPSLYGTIDVFIVVLGCVDLYILPAIGMTGRNLAFIRLFRLTRLARTLRIIRVLKVFSKLRVLVSTVAASVMALFWSMVLLIVLMFMGSTFVCQMVQQAVLNGDMDPELREWAFRSFGTSGRSFWSMFEITLGSQGTSIVRPLVQQLHWVYGLFFGLYISAVVFAVICIIEALFLKDTLEMAANDAEMMMQQQLAAKRNYARRLRAVFHEVDKSGDGLITQDELEEVLTCPEVRIYWQTLDLEVNEITALFHMLDNGDGVIDYEEFVAGIMRLKGQARSMDMIAVMQDTQKVKSACGRIEQMCAKLMDNAPLREL